MDMHFEPACNEPLETAAGLAVALDMMDQGFLWIDENLMVRQYNLAYRRLLNIENANQFVGHAYRDLLQFLLERGEFIEVTDQDRYLTDCLHATLDGGTRRYERVRPDGTVLRISGAPLAAGGCIYTYLDITREIRAQEEVRRAAKAAVVAMANFAEHRDTDTGVHVLRVARLVAQTARKLKRGGKFAAIVDDVYIDHVGTASILHDVGKISTPDRILMKVGSLSDEERGIIKLHAAVGAQLLKQAHVMMGESAYLKIGADIALTHHEWFDGSGYPSGLAGQDIPLAGRICAIADVFDALTSRRPYKAPWSTEQAVAQLRKQSGTQFDPAIVEAFIEMIDERETVSLVQWSEAMSLGNQHIDEQHQILIDTINQLASAESQNDRPTISMIIDELVSYTAFHFQFEEQLIEAAGYPELDKHRRIHRDFVEWVTGVREDFVYHRRERIGEQILSFLRDWLRDHILGEDQRYRPFIGN